MPAKIVKPKRKGTGASVAIVETYAQPYGLRTPRTSTTFGAPIADEDLKFALEREPIGNRIIAGIAEDVFDNWFKIVDLDNLDSDDLDKEVQSELEGLHAKKYLTLMATLERAFGYSIILVGYGDATKSLAEPVTRNKKIVDLEVFYKQTIEGIDEDKDENSIRYGLPQTYRIKLTSETGTNVDYTRVIHCATRCMFHRYIGESTIAPIIDDLTSFRNIRYGLALTILRYGHGFPHVVKTGATKKAIRDFINSDEFAALTAMKGFVSDELTTLEFKGMAGKALNPEPYCVPSLESISAGSRIPLAIIRGVQAGALTGSEVNEREYFKIISDNQSKYEPNVRDLITKILGYLHPDEEINFKITWNGGFELTEKEKADIELIHQQAISLKLKWRTLNEIRKEELGEDAPMLPEGDKLAGQGQVQPQNPFSSPSNGIIDTVAEPATVPETEQILTQRLNEIRSALKDGKLKTVDEAMLTADMVITDHIAKMRRIAQLQIELKSGRSVGDLSPEQQLMLVNMQKRFSDSFRKILEDQQGEK